MAPAEGHLVTSLSPTQLPTNWHQAAMQWKHISMNLGLNATTGWHSQLFSALLGFQMPSSLPVYLIWGPVENVMEIITRTSFYKNTKMQLHTTCPCIISGGSGPLKPTQKCLGIYRSLWTFMLAAPLWFRKNLQEDCFRQKYRFNGTETWKMVRWQLSTLEFPGWPIPVLCMALYIPQRF